MSNMRKFVLFNSLKQGSMDTEAFKKAALEFREAYCSELAFKYMRRGSISSVREFQIAYGYAVTYKQSIKIARKVRRIFSAN